MDKRYQIFVSSTYTDLIKERQEVLKAILELQHFPSEMELFPAADEDAWTYIKDVIDQCDYYVLILAGRYGSVDDSGMSYTEKEYRYALETKKPILSFLHENPGGIPKDMCDTDEAICKKLESFRDLAKDKLCKYWTTADQLGAYVTRGLVNLIATKPSSGWVRADSVPNERQLANLQSYRDKARDLEQQLNDINSNSLNNIDPELQFEKGELEIPYIARYVLSDEDNQETDDIRIEESSYKRTWIYIFNALASKMELWRTAADIAVYMEMDCLRYLKSIQSQHEDEDLRNRLIRGIKITTGAVADIIVQFRALKLWEKQIVQGERSKQIGRRPVSLSHQFQFRNSAFGESVMMRLRAKKNIDLQAEMDA